MNFASSFKAELILLKRRNFPWLLALAGIIIVSFLIWRHYSEAVRLFGEVVRRGENASKQQNFFYWLQPERVVLFLSASISGGIPLLLFIYAGAAWADAEIATGVLKYYPLINRETRKIALAKLLALFLYVFFLYLVLASWGIVFAAVYVSRDITDYLTACFNLTNLKAAVFSLLPLTFWAFTGFAFTILCTNSLLGLAVPSLWRYFEGKVLSLSAVAKLKFLFPWHQGQRLLLLLVEKGREREFWAFAGSFGGSEKIIAASSSSLGNIFYFLIIAFLIAFLSQLSFVRACRKAK